MSRGLTKWVDVGLAALLGLSGCTGPRQVVRSEETGEYCPPCYDMDTVSSTVRRQPSLLLKLPGEEQVINPSWLGWTGVVAAGTAATAGVVTVVELSTREEQELEEALQQCAQQAELTVNRLKLGQDGLPAPEECHRVELVDDQGKRITLAMVLGDLKHREALKCVAEQVAPRYPGRILIEPRYRYYEGADRTEYVSPEREDWLLRNKVYNELERSLFPDIVIILEGNPYKIQAIYDYKFPCTDAEEVPRWSAYSSQSPFATSTQREIYKKAGKVDPKRITPKKIRK